MSVYDPMMQANEAIKQLKARLRQKDKEDSDRRKFAAQVLLGKGEGFQIFTSRPSSTPDP